MGRAIHRRRRNIRQELKTLGTHGHWQRAANPLPTRCRRPRPPPALSTTLTSPLAHRRLTHGSPPSRVPSILSAAHVFHLSIPASADLSAAGPARNPRFCWPQCRALVQKRHRETMQRARASDMAWHGGRSERSHPLLLPQSLTPWPARLPAAVRRRAPTPWPAGFGNAGSAPRPRPRQKGGQKAGRQENARRPPRADTAGR